MTLKGEAIGLRKTKKTGERLWEKKKINKTVECMTSHPWTCRNFEEAGKTMGTTRQGRKGGGNSENISKRKMNL